MNDFKSYFATIAYSVWAMGADPEAMDRSRIQKWFEKGLSVDVATLSEFNHQHCRV